MSIGQTFIYALFILDIIVFGIYLLSINDDRLRVSGRKGSWLMFAISGIATVYLSYLFLTNDFSVKYVHDHCSLSMQPMRRTDWRTRICPRDTRSSIWVRTYSQSGGRTR